MSQIDQLCTKKENPLPPFRLCQDREESISSVRERHRSLLMSRGAVHQPKRVRGRMNDGGEACLFCLDVGDVEARRYVCTVKREWRGNARRGEGGRALWTFRVVA